MSKFVKKSNEKGTLNFQRIKPFIPQKNQGTTRLIPQKNQGATRFIPQKNQGVTRLIPQKNQGRIYIKSTRNNTIITLSDLQGNVKYWSSAGHVGFKNSRKSTNYAAQAVAEKVAIKALDLGFQSILLNIQGLGYGKLPAIRALSKSKLNILKIHELTPIAHNGCRPSKKRRI